MNGMWFVGILALALGVVALSLVPRWQRYWRTLRRGIYVNATVFEMSLSGLRALGGSTVWVNLVLSSVLPNGSTRRYSVKVPVHPDRLDDVQPGCALRARVDPLGERDGYDYIQPDVDGLGIPGAQRRESGER